MKKIICAAAAAFACTGAFAQAPDVMPGPAKGSNDRVLLLGAHQMPLPPPPAELLKMQSMSKMKAEDGFSLVDKAPERVRRFMNDLDVVKGHQSSAAEAGAFAETLKSGKAIPTAPMVSGKSAISAVFTDDSGQRIEEVRWVDGGKLNKVTFAPDMQNARDGLTKTNSSVSAFSLASELR